MNANRPDLTDAGGPLYAFQLVSPLGPLCGVVSPSGLCMLRFGTIREETAFAGFPEQTQILLRVHAFYFGDGSPPYLYLVAGTPFADWMTALRKYLHGQSKQLDIPVDLRLAQTPFQRAVYEALLRVQPGQTTSYGELAQAVGKPQASRAVGQAVGHNPICIVVPCHRVLGKDGSLHGFAFGLAKKAALLKLEGVRPTSANWEREVRADSQEVRADSR
jgi:O-6-methylguanine DNA methyltransferase